MIVANEVEAAALAQLPLPVPVPPGLTYQMVAFVAPDKSSNIRSRELDLRIGYKIS
jgi:hypothetical protein